MAKGEGFIEQNGADLSNQVLRKVFVEKSRFREGLRDQGIRIGPEEPTSVATIRTIQLELEQAGVAKKFSRKLATQISGSLIRGDHPRLFSPGEPLTIEAGNVGSTKLFRRSDLNLQRAGERLPIYEQLLVEVQETRAADIREIEELKREEASVPSTASVRIISPYLRSDFNDRVSVLTQQAERNIRVEAITHGVEGTTDNVDGIYHDKDLDYILDNGLNQEQLQQLINKARNNIAHATELNETNTTQMVQIVKATVDKRLAHNARTYDFPVLIVRDIQELVMLELIKQNSNPNVQIFTEFPDATNKAPFPREVLKQWGGRYSAEKLANILEQLRAQDPETAKTVETLLRQDNCQQILYTLQDEGKVLVEESEIDKKELEQKLLPVIVPDQILIQALMADLIGRVYPTLFTTKGKSYEEAQVALRTLAEQFTPEEIAALLVQREVKIQNNPQIEKLERQLAAKNSQIDNTPSQNRQRIQALIREREQLEKRLRGSTTENTKTVPVKENIEGALLSKLPADHEDPINQAFIKVNPEHEITNQTRRLEMAYDVAKKLKGRTFYSLIPDVIPQKSDQLTKDS